MVIEMGSHKNKWRDCDGDYTGVYEMGERITVPKKLRKEYRIPPGSGAEVEPRGGGELVVRRLDRDPSEMLEELLGGFEYSWRDRVRAERLLVDEASLE